MTIRILVAVAVLAVIAGGAWWYSRRRAADVADVDALPPLPPEHRTPGTRTWVVFTTPYCATCDQVAAGIRAAEPDSAVLIIDATVETELADSYRVRTAPTVIVAEPDGTVRTRLVGSDGALRMLRRGV